MMLAVIVIEALLIVAHGSWPMFQRVSLQYRASDVVRQMYEVRRAAESARQSGGAWPADAMAGETPERLAAFLRPGFAFSHPDYQLDWEAWELADGRALGARGGTLAGVSVATRDARLAAAVARQLKQGETRITLGNRTTLVIAEPSALAP